MKIKMTRTQLNALIQEEVERFKKIKELEQKQKQLSEAVKKLDEGQDIDELFGGVSHLLKKAGQGFTGAVKRQASNAAQGLKDLGQDFVDVGKQAWQDTKNLGNQIATTYKQGEEMHAKKQAQNKISNIHSQIKQLMNQYQQLTGKPFNPTAVAGPAAFRKATAPSPDAGTEPVSNAA